ncbi:fimbrial protein [Stenotrophomonas sp.]|uniref:fimbrial protein n=1 Tax=Stenotrophomonas sp. TaxID=69392 RepID=UPI002FC5DDE6
MKILLTPFALAALLGAHSANAADLTITGEIVESTCTAAINGNLDVLMGKMDLEDLKTNNRIGRRDLDVTVACPGASGSQDVAVKFSGTANADGSLGLTAASTAKGVSYMIYDASDAQLAINGAPTQFVTVTGTGSQTLKHSVWYSKTTAAADTEAGTANATAQMDIIYK